MLPQCSASGLYGSATRGALYAACFGIEWFVWVMRLSAST
ncbi:hypothetical protein SAMN02800694_2435 [Luteibacter sp. UNCMF331Sha3.1]|nr:hypothetical protein SAMN02800694_2435 [Luteibacter sp. UNCMF331Sha3.1]